MNYNTQVSILYWSYLIIPILLFTIYKLTKWNKNSKKKNTILTIILLFSLLYTDCRFIEPNILTVKKTQINIWLENQVKIALVSDFHIWVYKKTSFLEKTVKEINKIEELNYVLIAWDLTYYRPTGEMFLPLKDIKVPTYFVLWNHDNINNTEKNEKFRRNILSVMNSLWLDYLDNKIIETENFYLVWLWSNSIWDDNIELLNKLKEEDKIIVLTHSPDTTLKYTNNKADLTLCWHTHWWQLKIPFLYKNFIPTEWNFDEWLTDEKYTKLFISSGIWEIWLPFRFLNPPVIDILEIN